MSMMNIDSVTAQLSKMSPQQLQQFASMHMDDPIMLAAAKFVSNQQTKLQQSRQPQPGTPPKVNEQTVASIAPQAAPQPQATPQAQQAQGLPEGSGIAQLPAQNMQGMAGGGIVAFARGGDSGENSPASYRSYAMQRAQEMGIDPTFADSIFGIESGYKADAVSPTGPVGVGQLTKKTGEHYGVPASERKDPYKNIDASLAFMADLNKKYQGDPEKMAVAYNQGETVLNKHLRANAGEINPKALPKEAQGYLAKLGKRMTAALPMATAQAETIPGRQPPAGIPADITRGVDNKALVASTGLAALPAAASALRAPSMAVGPATATGGTGRALQTAASRLSPYLRPASMGPAGPVIAGGAALATGAANALSNATPEQLAQLQSDVGSDTGLAAAIMNPANRGPQAPVSPVLEAARKAQAQDNTPSDTVYDPMTGIPMYGTETTTGDDRTFRERLGLGNVANRKALEELERIQRLKNLPPTKAGAGRGAVNPPMVTPEAPEAPEEVPELPKAAQKEVIATAKQNVPEGTDTKGFTNEDWLNLGFGLLAGKSQYAMQNLGEAGIATLAAKQARTKAGIEARKAEADIAQSGIMGKYYESLATQDKTPADIKMIERYASDPKFAAAVDAMAGAKRAPADEAKLKELWSKDLMLQQKYPEVGDFLRMMQSASAGDAVPSVVSGNVAAGQVRAP